MASASDLLSLLRTGSVPQPRPSPSPSASVYQTPLQSSAASLRSVDNPLSQQNHQDGMSALLAAFATPSPNAPQTSEERETTRSFQVESVPGGYPVAAGGAGAGAGAGRDPSASLLALLRGTGTPSAPTPSSVPASPLPPTASTPLSPTNASDLLASMMSGGPVRSSQPPPPPPATTTTSASGPASPVSHRDDNDTTTTPPSIGATPTKQQPAPTSSQTQPPPQFRSSPGQPNFRFVSPFEFLDRTHSQEKLAASRKLEEGVSPMSSLPPHIRSSGPVAGSGSGPRSRSASPSKDREEKPVGPKDPTPAASPAPSLPSSPLHQQTHLSNGNGSHDSFGTSTFLSSSLLSPASSLPFHPSWAPSSLGLRLPRSAFSLSSPQTLQITVAHPHRESLASSLPATTPITLMDLSSGGWSRGRLAGVWEGGIGYATKGDRVRVIERESGGRALLKPAKGGKEKKGSKGAEKRIVELAVAPGTSSEEGGEKRHLVTATDKGGLTLWSISERFADEAEASHERLLDLSFPTTSAPTLVRFHPQYPAKQILAVVFSNGSAALLDIEGALSGEKVAKGEDVLEKYGEKIEKSEPIIDLTFSPDGSVFATLTSSSNYAVRSTANPSKILFSGAVPLPPSSSPISSRGTSSTATPIASAFPRPDDIVPDAKEDGEGEVPAEPSEIILLTDRASSRPSAVAVSFSKGTEVVVFPLRNRNNIADSSEDLPPSSITSLSFPLPASASAETADQHHGHLAYHASTQSLVVSSSLRGSLFTFRFTFPPVPTSPSADVQTDEDFLTLLLARFEASNAQPARIDHVLETPLTGGAVVGFVLDPSAESRENSGAEEVPQAVQATGKTSFGVLVSHQNGIDLVQILAEKPREYRLPAVALEPATPAMQAVGSDDEHDPHQEDVTDLDTDADADEFERAMAAGRRMSLEGSIYVSSEVEVTVEGPQSDEEVLASPPPTSNGLRHHHNHDDEAEGDEDEPPTPLANTNSHTEYSFSDQQQRQPPRQPSSSSAHPEDAQSSLDEPTLGDLAVSGLPATPNVEPSSPVFPTPPSATLTPPPATASRLRTPPRSPSSSARLSLSPGGGGAVGGDMETILREVRRVEAGFKSEIGRVVRGELEKHIHQIDEDRAHTAAAQTAREEALLKLALGSVKKDTTKLVETAVREQIRQQVGPAVGPVVQQAVRQEVARGVEGALKQILPAELEKQFSRPNVAFPLASTIATTIAPPLERSLVAALASSVVPAFERSISSAVDAILTQIRQEMLDVRKEIVLEQSAAVSILEDEVSALRSEVGGMKAQMERMEQLILAQSSIAADRQQASPRIQQHGAQLRARPSGANANIHSSPATGSNTSALASPTHSRTLPSHPALSTLPPIPRTQTPPERYEELFTETMQPQHEPEFTALVHLINASPASRLDAVFPPAGTGEAKISMAVVLSLAYRLSQLLSAGEGPLNEEGRKMLGWLRRAVTACDGKQTPDFHDVIPRIFSNVLDHLVLRGRKLMTCDPSGAGELRTVDQYVRARLNLFQQGGGEGPEGFRR